MFGKLYLLELPSLPDSAVSILLSFSTTSGVSGFEVTFSSSFSSSSNPSLSDESTFDELCYSWELCSIPGLLSFKLTVINGFMKLFYLCDCCLSIVFGTGSLALSTNVEAEQRIFTGGLDFTLCPRMYLSPGGELIDDCPPRVSISS